MRYSDKLWWLWLLLTLTCGGVVLDHLLEPVTHQLTLVGERHYQEISGFRRSSRIESINANVLRFSDGTVLQVGSVNDWISIGDTLEVQRTPLFSQPLQFRKKKARSGDWQEAQSNKLEHRPYPYIVFACAFLLLFPWPSDTWRWSLQGVIVLTLVGWLLMMIGTGGLGRLYQLL